MPWLSILSVWGLHSRWAVLMLMTVFALAAAGQEPADADAALRRTRQRLLADLERMPRYTCVQTINREYYRPRSDGASCATLMAEHEQQAGKLVLRGWDRLRLEVAIVEGRSVYSWVGAPRFGSDTLEQLAGRGPLSSGDFGPFLNSIFNVATLTFKSEERAGQRRLFAYSYDMPVDRSRYSLKGNVGWVVTAYNGTLVIDPDAADIVSLTVRTAELPESSPACQAISEVEYGRTQIHDRMVLIPRQTRLITIDRQGGETRSLTTYPNCREYASKVRLLFQTTPDGAASSTLPAQQSPPRTLPAGLHFRARIVTTIDSNTAAAGDPIEAVLLSPIRGTDRREWASAGAHLHGRLLGLEQSMSPSFFRVLMQFESVELNGNAVPLRAAPDVSVLSGISTVGGHYQPAVSVIPGDAARNNIFISRKEHLHLEKFDWGWTTLDVPEQQKEKKDETGAH
jgi:hypothetical protein